MRINSNLEALNAHRHLSTVSSQLAKSMERLSSGLRINRASDDAAGLAISEKILGQVNGLNQATRNAQDAISLVQTAEGALQETHSILQRMRELAVQAANDTLTQDDRNAIKSEIDNLLKEVTRIANDTEFNTMKLLDGQTVATAGLSFQVGANAGQVIALTIAGASAGALAIEGIGVTDAAAASAAIASLDTAINAVSTARANLGAMQNRLEHTIANLGVASENLQAANSRIRDVDMAAEMMTYTKLQILQQAGTAMLAQANLAPQAVLKLLA
ncbi:MAG TPA: flagellin FliC [Firmicutes bacterium]|nr:flagellin FliC [Bacillota bacterium]